MYRVVTVLSAVFMWTSAFLGMDYSDATWVSQTQAPLQISAAPDWTPPAVTMTSLASGVQGTAVSVSADASDSISAIGTMLIEFSPAGVNTWQPITSCAPMSGSNPASLSCTWDTTAVADGDYELRATATDTESNSATSAIVSTSVVNNAAAVLSALPTAVRGTVSLRGDLFNTGGGGTTLYLEYRQPGDAWVELCSQKANPLVCSWNTVPLPNGAYDVRVRASSGQTDSQTVTVDNAKPSVSLSVPSGVLGGTVMVTASPDDGSGSGVESVRFEYQPTGGSTWTICGTDLTSPYTCNLDTMSLQDGASYDLRAVAADVAGNTANSAVVTRTVSNAPAGVAISSPKPNAAVDGSVVVQVAANSPRGVVAVRVDARSTVTGTWGTVCSDATAPYSCTWETAGLDAGGYELRAVLSQNGALDMTSASVPVSVDHSIGIVSISSPSTGDRIDHQPTFQVTGTTSTTHGVSAVSLRAIPTSPTGPTQVYPCTLTSGGFTCDWATSSVVYGQYELRADMVQGNGVTVTSVNPVSVVVDNIQASVTLSMLPLASSGYVAGTEALTATANSNLPVSSVVFQRSSPGQGDWQQLCSSISSPPYTCSWDTTALPNTSFDVRALMRLSNGDTRSSSATVTVDNLWAADVQAGNGDGYLAVGDSFSLTYSTVVDPATIRQDWDGASTPVSVPFVAGSPNSFSVSGTHLGTITFPEDQVKKSFVASGDMTAAVVDGHTVVTIGFTSVDGSKVRFDNSPGGALVWTPTSDVHASHAGNACSPLARQELGVLDPDF